MTSGCVGVMGGVCRCEGVMGRVCRCDKWGMQV